MSLIDGQFVTNTPAYDGGRQVTAYVPLNPPKAIVFASDGAIPNENGVPAFALGMAAGITVA